MKVFALSSGSSGNCCFVRGENTSILIDAGISVSKIASRLNEIGESIEDIDAVFITHEHYDHMCGLLNLKKRVPKIKIFAHKAVCKAIANKHGFLSSSLEAIESAVLYFGEFLINAFELSHDSCACLGYSIYLGASKFSIATDCGVFDDDAINNVYDSDLIFLESNYSEEMLDCCTKYTEYLKQRIRANTGHLSNKATASVIKKILTKRQSENLSEPTIVLAHLSQNSNSKEVCQTEVGKFLDEQNATCNFCVIEHAGVSEVYII